MYTNDAVICPPNSNIITGKGNVAQFWERNRIVQGLSFDPVSVKVLSESALRAVGTMSLQLDPQTPDRSAEAGQQIKAKYIWVWQKVDGAWKIESGIWTDWSCSTVASRRLRQLGPEDLVRAADGARVEAAVGRAADRRPRMGTRRRSPRRRSARPRGRRRGWTAGVRPTFFNHDAMRDDCSRNCNQTCTERSTSSPAGAPASIGRYRISTSRTWTARGCEELSRTSALSALTSRDESSFIPLTLSLRRARRRNRSRQRTPGYTRPGQASIGKETTPTRTSAAARCRRRRLGQIPQVLLKSKSNGSLPPRRSTYEKSAQKLDQLARAQGLGQRHHSDPRRGSLDSAFSAARQHLDSCRSARSSRAPWPRSAGVHIINA